MKIQGCFNTFRKIVIPAVVAGGLVAVAPQTAFAQTKMSKDTYVRSQEKVQNAPDKLFPLTDEEELLQKKDLSKPQQTVFKDTLVNLVKGTNNAALLKNAPSASVTIAGREKFAKYVIDLSQNMLYKYDNAGKAVMVYSVATGKKSTPTHKGVRVVTGIEEYPYSKAYGTKRKLNPRDYGPYVLCLNILDPKTGEKLGSDGQFIHGNNNSKSIGKYASKGCIRMDNDVIRQFAKNTKIGDIVLIK